MSNNQSTKASALACLALGTLATLSASTAAKSPWRVKHSLAPITSTTTSNTFRLALKTS